MKLKRIKKKLFISLFLIAICGALGVGINKMIGGEHANAEDEGAGIIIDYDTTSSHVLGEPDDAANPYLNIFSTATENRLENWTDTGATYGVISDRIVFSSNNKWQDGKMQVAGMRPVKWLEIPAGVKGSEYWGNNVYWITTDKTGKYSVKVTVLETMNYTFTNNPQPLLVGRDGNYVAVRNVYNKNCTTVGSCGDPLLVYEVDTETNNYAQVFIKLKFEITNRPRISYLQIDDIDFAQSYRIENQGVCDSSRAGTKKCDIYVKNADVSEFTVNQYNNAQENYIKYDNDNVTIFSSISPGSVIGGVVERAELFNSNDKANIYLKLQNDTQSNTINTVYGFRHDALSYWNFYAEAYNVVFKAVDQNNQPKGSIFAYNGTDPYIGDSVDTKVYIEETIGTFPTIRSDSRAQYSIDYWVADKNVTINGSTISAGSHITPAQMSTLVQTFAIENDYTFTAHLKLNTYTINFKDYDNTNIKSFTCSYGEDITSKVPADPERSGTAQYSWPFAGWSPAVNQTCTGDATYTATYNESTNQYTVTFVNDDDSVLQTSEYNYGDTPSYNGSTPPVKAGSNANTYRFIGWDKTIVPVTGDVTYKAVYEIINYTITFYDEDEETVLLTKDNYHYGNNIVLPSPAPEKPSTAQYQYTFSGYEPMGDSPELTAHSTVTGDAEYRATYIEELRSYTIVFVDDDDKPIDSQEVEYGKTPTVPSDPKDKTIDNCTYKFTGWDNEIVPVTGPKVYKATYTKGSCTKTPNTSGDDKTILGNVTKTTSVLPFAMVAIIVAVVASIFYRLYRRSKTMKF